MKSELVVTVNGIDPGAVWKTPPDQIDSLAEFLVNSMIEARKNKNSQH